MMSRVLAVLVASVLAVGLATVPAQAAAGSSNPGPTWAPPAGAVFNNPYGPDNARYRIERRLLRAIRETPRNGHIRISVYSFDRIVVAKALIRAHQKRHVQVQILMNDHQVTKAQRMLFRGIGRNPKKDNFAYECDFSCRGRRDNLHSKFYLFDQTGKAQKVIMLGSQNFTLNAEKWQWNDLVTVKGRKHLYANFVSLFDDMRHDYQRNQPYYTFCGKSDGKRCYANHDTRFTRVFPRKSSASDDPVLNMMKPIRCIYTTDSGVTKRTHVRLSMHTMQGDRGQYLAARVRQLWVDGCDVKVIYGLMGWHVKKTLGATTSRGRIPLRSAGFDYDGDGSVNRYTHQKYFLIRGMYAGSPTSITYTGSANWTTRGTSGDEIIFSIRSRDIHSQYAKNFDLMWNSDRYTRDSYTTTSSDYKTYVTRVDTNGKPTTRVLDAGHPTVAVRPDGLRPGKTWEDD